MATSIINLELQATALTADITSTGDQLRLFQDKVPEVSDDETFYSLQCAFPQCDNRFLRKNDPSEIERRDELSCLSWQPGCHGAIPQFSFLLH